MYSVPVTTPPPPPPFGIPVIAGDTIELSAWAIAALTMMLQVDIVDNAGVISPLTLTLTTNSNRSGKSLRLGIGFPGRVVAAGISLPTGTAPLGPGEMWVEGNVIRGGQQLATLFCGYFYPGHVPSYPGRGPESPYEGFGRIVEFTTAVPGAGAEVAAKAVPANAIWIVRSYRVQMVQGATQTPRARLNIRDGSAVSLALLPSQAILTANTTVDYTWALHGPNISDATAAALVQSMSLPQLQLLPGFDIGTSTSGLGANSQYGAATMMVEEWLQTQ